MHNHTTLESVTKELNEWRNKKTALQHRIPESIRASLKSISKHYSYQQMAKAFNIYGHRLKNIIQPSKLKNNQIKFIELPAAVPKSNLPVKSQPSTLTCTLQHPNGTTMTLTLSTQQLTAAIKDFVCCN